MSNGPDWGKCVETGQAKSMGVSWNEAELKARYELKIPADFVRNGCLTLEDYEKAKKYLEVQADVEKEESATQETQGKPVPPHRYWKKEKLVEAVKARGLVFDESAVTRTDLFLMFES